MFGFRQRKKEAAQAVKFAAARSAESAESAESTQTAYLIVGLGNPGKDYEGTRHNAGRLVVDLLAKELGANYWKTECGSQTASVTHKGTPLILAKPTSFMNLSGGPVKQLCKQYGIAPDHLVVVHDELDIEAATVRVKQGGGHAGHNGLRSIIDKLQTRDWLRVRIGIGRPPGRMDPSDFVLSEARGEDAKRFAHACRLGTDATLALVAHGLEGVRRTYH